MASSEFGFRAIINSCLYNVVIAKTTEYMMKMVNNENGSVASIMTQINDIKLFIINFIKGMIESIKLILLASYGYNPCISCLAVFVAVVFVIAIITLIRFMIKTSKNDITEDKDDSEEKDDDNISVTEN
jgi:hypothetical protein